MTPKQQRIAIAKACGWKSSEPKGKWCHPRNWSMARNGSYEVWVGFDQLPDYLSDLNAMHEVEKVLTPLQWFDYSALLTKLVGPKDQEYYLNLHATATQRAEAFLRTLNLWTD